MKSFKSNQRAIINHRSRTGLKEIRLDIDMERAADLDDIARSYNLRSINQLLIKLIDGVIDEFKREVTNE